MGGMSDEYGAPARFKDLAGDAVDHQAMADRLVALCATVLRAADEEIDRHVLADPEGNEFCVFTPAT
jgi:hypothetical protein